MPHFAKLDENNVVVFVTVGSDIDDGKEKELSERTGDIYKQTSYNTHAGVHSLGGIPYRKNFASIGYTYDENLDAFIPPKIYPSWVLDTAKCVWIAPISYPNDGNVYKWDENVQNWALNDP